MEKYLKNKIQLCENSKLYMFAEFYRNTLKAFYKCDPEEFKTLVNYNIECSNIYFLDSLLEIKHKI